MRSRNGSRRRVLSQEERVLWTAFTRSIEPMRASTLVAEEPESDARPASARPQAAAGRSKAPAPARVEPAPAPPALAPLSRRMRRSVARGKETIDARIDLHGLTQAKAHSALLQFLRSASAREARLVLVITGKGGRGDGERGVLKRQVPQWLGLPEFRSFVVGFEDAHIAHGGEGALYVRIRKSKTR
jgi:DNA-nicking Smr family endonuclease